MPRKAPQPKAKVEEPKVEVAKVEEPKVEVEKAKVEEPKIEEPKVELVLSTSDVLKDIAKQLDGTSKLLRLLATEVRKCSKDHDKEIKIAIKQKGGKKDVDPNKPKRQPSGITKPALISDELADFLGVPHGSELSRPDVSKRIGAYIKEHDLQNPANKRIIFPDEAFGKLLRYDSTVEGIEQLSYFNMQKYLKIHYPKA